MTAAMDSAVGSLPMPTPAEMGRALLNVGTLLAQHDVVVTQAIVYPQNEFANIPVISMTVRVEDVAQRAAALSVAPWVLNQKHGDTDIYEAVIDDHHVTLYLPAVA